MPKRGRPRKVQSLFTVKNYIEYTSDSDSDANNVHNNAGYEIAHGSVQSIRGQQEEVQNNPVFPPQAGGKQINQVIPDDNEQPDNDQLHELNVPLLHNPEFEQQQFEDEQGHPYIQDEQGDNILQLEEQDEQQQAEEVENLSESEVESENNEDYDTIFDELKAKWILAETHHSVSKSASEHFWKIAVHFFPKLIRAQPIKPKKIVQFKTIRNQMHDDLIPLIDLKFCFKNKLTGQIKMVNNTITPVKDYPPDKFEKQYEISTVKVS